MAAEKKLSDYTWKELWNANTIPDATFDELYDFLLREFSDIANEGKDIKDLLMGIAHGDPKVIVRSIGSFVETHIERYDLPENVANLFREAALGLQKISIGIPGELDPFGDLEIILSDYPDLRGLMQILQASVEYFTETPIDAIITLSQREAMRVMFDTQSRKNEIKWREDDIKAENWARAAAFLEERYRALRDKPTPPQPQPTTTHVSSSGAQHGGGGGSFGKPPPPERKWPAGWRQAGLLTPPPKCATMVAIVIRRHGHGCRTSSKEET